MFQTSKAGRRFHRVALNARVAVIDQQGVTTHCECVDFSEDGIDLRLLDRFSSFTAHALVAGALVDIEIEGPENPPRIRAAVIKASNQQIGLRFLKNQTH